MVRHIGIEPHLGKISIYDSVTKTAVETISAKYHCNYPNECSHFFNKILQKIGKSGIGNIAICCDGGDSNDFRKACLQGAKNVFGQNGYSVKIISKDVAFFIQAILQTSFSIFEGQSLALIYTYGFDEICMQIWSVKKDGAVLEYCFVVEQNESSWDILKTNLKQIPHLQLTFLVESYWKKEFSDNFGISPKTFEHSYSFFSEAAVIVARNDKSLKYLTAQNTLNRDIIVSIGEEITFEVERSRQIPLKEIITVNVPNRDSLCKINEKYQNSFIKAITLPRSHQIDIMLSVNENGIYTFIAEPLYSRQSSIKTQPSITSQTSVDSCEGKNVRLLLPDPSFYLEFSTPIVGIDFGTTKCTAAISHEQEYIDTFDLDPCLMGHSLSAYVSYSESTVKCGQAAKDKLRSESKYTVFDIKRIIGRHLSEIKADILWPFELAEKSDGIKIGLHTFSGKHWLAPEEMASVFFKHIKTTAEEFIKAEVSEVVITIPQSFNDEKITAISTAAKLAGWETFHLLTEPIAAIFGYHFYDPIPEHSNLLLFDLGGGSLTACIATVSGEYLQVLGNESDENLGGINFDGLLLNYFSTIMMKQHNIEIMTSEKKKFKLMLKCNKIKHNLSIRTEQTLDVDDFDSSIDATIIIKRSIFELISSELLERIKALITATLLEARIIPSQINLILKIGEASKMPMISELLQQIFPLAEIIDPEDGEKLIAKGATLHGIMLKSGTNKAAFY